MSNLNKKQSIIFIIPSLGKGGAEKVSLNLAKGIAKQNFKITIIYFNQNNFDEKDIKREFNINFIFIKNKRLRFSFIKTYLILKKIKPQYIFSSLSHINIYLLILKFLNLIRSKIIIRESNLPSIQIKFSKINRILKFSYKYLYKYSDLIICSSPLMIMQFNKNFNLSLDKLFLLYNPVDIGFIKKKSLPIIKNNKNIVNFIAVGRLEYQKAFDELIILFSKIVKIKYKLLIIGSGPEKEKLEILIKKNNLKDKIALLGYKENPYNIISNSDYLISLSRWEGMPNSILETLALGKKVIFLDRLNIFKSFNNVKFNDLIIIDNMESLEKYINQIEMNNNKDNLKSNLPKNFYLDNVSQEFKNKISKL